jgi:hypothetical protein
VHQNEVTTTETTTVTTEKNTKGTITTESKTRPTLDSNIFGEREKRSRQRYKNE